MSIQYHHFKEPQRVIAYDIDGEPVVRLALGYWADSDWKQPTFCLARGGAKDGISGEWFQVEMTPSGK